MTDQPAEVVDNGPIESHEVPQIPRYDAGELQAAANIWRSVANGLRSTMDTTQLQVTSASADWTGGAREAFLHEWNILAGNVLELSTELDGVATHIEALIAELEHQRQEFEKLLAEIGLTIVLGFAASFFTFGGAAAVSGVKAAMTIRRLWLVIEAVGNAVARFALRAAGGSLRSIVTRFVVNVGVYSGTQVAANIIDDPRANPFRDINPVDVTIAGAIGIFLPFNGAGNPVLRGAANNVTTEALIEAFRDRRLDPGNLAFAAAAGGVTAGVGNKIAKAYRVNKTQANGTGDPKSSRREPNDVKADRPPAAIHTYSVGDIDTVATHLSGEFQSPANDQMISRIRDAISRGAPLTSSQENFMKHELTEARLMKGGISYEDAHQEALSTHPPGKNYDVDIIDGDDSFGMWWREQNGLPPRTG